MTASPIPFCDLQRANAPIRKELDRAIGRCMDRSTYLRGPETAAFEEEWADYCGQAHAVCCNSGTDALTIAASAAGLTAAVIPATTLPLTGIGLHRGGAAVRLADVDDDGHLTPEPDAVPVLLYGRLPSALSAPAVLHDAAHAHGWRPPPGAAAAWSFYPTKTLGALGDAGAVTTDDAALADAMRDLCGRDDRLRSRRQITSRIDEVQAAVLRVKLRHLDDWLTERRAIGDHYRARLHPLGLTLPGPSLDHLLVIRVASRDDLAATLAQRGIEAKVHWPLPLHRLDGPWQATGSFPHAEAWCSSVLSLPCFPGLREREVERVCDAVERWFAGTTVD